MVGINSQWAMDVCLLERKRESRGGE